MLVNPPFSDTHTHTPSVKNTFPTIPAAPSSSAPHFHLENQGLVRAYIRDAHMDKWDKWVVFCILVFRWPVTYSLRNSLRRAYAIAWGSLRGVWFLRGAYASQRGVGFAYAAMVFVFSIVEWGFGTTSHNKYPTNKWVLTVASECLHKAYAV